MDEFMRMVDESGDTTKNPELSEKLWREILGLTKNSLTKEVNIGIDRPVEASDFVDQKEEILKNLNALYTYYSDDVPLDFLGFMNLRKDLKSEVVANTLLLAGEHNSCDDVWTTEVTVKLSACFADVLCELCMCNSIEEVLIEFDSCLQLVFRLLSSKLRKDTWKTYPAAVSSYVWIVKKIKKPNLGPVLRLIMPTTLILIDDYVNSNRVLGLQCLHHIICNVTTEELKSYADIDVFYKILEPLLFNSEPELIKPLINCLIVVINKKLSVNDVLKWTNFDDVMNILLPAIEMEQKVELRSAYMESLQVLVEAMGLGCVRWSKSFLRLFEEYAAVPYDREQCFKVMLSFIIATWPRLPQNFPRLITTILKSLVDITDYKNIGPKENVDDTIKAIRCCLNTLKHAAPNDMKEIRKAIISNTNFSTSFREYFLYQ